MASTASPYGLRAVNELGGLPYAGSTRTFLINPAGYAANIFNGSIVRVATTGYLELVTTNGDDSTPFPAGTSVSSWVVRMSTLKASKSGLSITPPAQPAW